MLKRGFDIVLSLFGLLILFPACLGVAALVGLFNGLPILFRQTRAGRGGRDFILLKFRTMTVAPEPDSGVFDAGAAARVTRLGAILRRTKLDELPQLWNVLKGDMSLVGPRPELHRWTALSPERWAKVHAVRPGLTGPAAIKYRNEEEILARADDPEKMYKDEILPPKLDLYEEYVQCHTFLGDLGLILRTFIAIILKM